MRNTHRQLLLLRLDPTHEKNTALEFNHSTFGAPTLKSILPKLTIAVLAAGLLTTLAGCTESAQESVADNPALASPVPEGAVRGTVLETMDSGGYTYVLMETDEEKRWVAAQQADRAADADDPGQLREQQPESHVRCRVFR